MHAPRYRHASYREGVMKPQELLETINDLADFLTQDPATRGLNFDTIVCSGISGLVVAPALAARMGKELLIVHKQGYKTHSPYDVEGNVASECYIIIDDLVDTGDTIRYIVEQVDRATSCSRGYGESDRTPARCMGVLLYAAKRAGRKKAQYWQKPDRIACSSGW